MSSMLPPLPIMPQQQAPRPTGMLAQGGTATTTDPSGSISAFMNNYISTKNMVRQMHAQKFQEGLQLAAQGIPVDNKSIMKHGRQAGYDWLPTDQYDEEEQIAAKSQAQSQVIQGTAAQAQNQMIPGSANPPANMGQLQQQAQMPIQPPQAQPNFLARLGQRLGVTSPQVSQNSPMGSWLDQLKASAQVGGGMTGDVARAGKLAQQTSALQDLQYGFQKQFGLPNMETEARQHGQIMQLTNAAFNGDPNAQESMARASHQWELPMDTFVNTMRAANPGMPLDQAKSKAAQLFQYVTQGPMQHKQFMLNFAKELAPRFPQVGGDPFKVMAFLDDPSNPNAPRPTMTLDEAAQHAKVAGTVMDSYKTAPGYFGDRIADTYLMDPSRGAELRDELYSQLNKRDAKGNPVYPRSGTQEDQRQQRQLGYDYAALTQKANNELDTLALNTATELAKEHQEKVDIWFKLRQDPNNTNDAFNAATQGLVNELGADPQIKVKYRGQDVSLGSQQVQSLMNYRPGWMLSGKAYVAPQQAPEAILQKILGDPTQASKIPAMRSFAAQAMQMPDGRERLHALGAVIQAMQGLPQTQRQLLIKQLELPADMRAAVDEATKTDIDLSGSPFLQR